MRRRRRPLVEGLKCVPPGASISRTISAIHMFHHTVQRNHINEGCSSFSRVAGRRHRKRINTKAVIEMFSCLNGGRELQQPIHATMATLFELRNYPLQNSACYNGTFIHIGAMTIPQG